jgi:rRNA small subunit pseudouridine methyltransferase Nep1
VVIILQKAALEIVKTKKGYELVSADSHKSLLNRHKKNPSDFRPDIVHQVLLTLLDSPLNKAGLLKIYIETDTNLIIDVSPSLRIPRTFPRFAGLMVQLLHKMKIRAVGSSEVLLKVVKRPISQYFPAGSIKIGTSNKGKLVDLRDYVPQLKPDTRPIVFAVGSMAHGQATVDWSEEVISISQYALSASVALGRICNAFENYWNIL